MTKNDNPLKKKKKKKEKNDAMDSLQKNIIHTSLGLLMSWPGQTLKKNYTSEKSKNPDCLMAYPDFPQRFAEYPENPDHFSKS